MRNSTVILICMVTLCSAFADEELVNRYIMNFDLLTKTADGDDRSSINLQGIHLHDGKVLQGDDLGEFRYFLTISGTDDRKGKLTIEFYEYESRNKTSDVVSEIVSEVEFTFGEPARFQSKKGSFGIDLAFSINQL